MTPTSPHLGLDDLADAQVGEAGPADAAHLQACERCRAALAELGAAQAPVRQALAALPQPVLPPDLAARVAAALEVAGRGAVVRLPRSRSRRPGPAVLAAAAVAALALGVSGADALLDRTGGRSADSATSSEGLAAPALAGPLTGVLDPATGAPDGALARLDDPAAMQSCLAGVGAGGAALAVERGRYGGQPALAVVLPGPSADLVRVVVVGAGCRRDAPSVLLSVTRPR